MAREAIALAKETGQKRVLLFNLSGHGLLDLSAYETYQSGNCRMSNLVGLSQAIRSGDVKRS